MMPVIGISAFPNAELRAHKTNTKYIEAVVNAQGTPLLLPSVGSQQLAGQMVGRIDGLLIPGGPDVTPLLYGEEPHPNIGTTCEQNDLFEFHLLRAARAAGKPIFGICRGMQVINTCFGGVLWQDLTAQTESDICHAQSKLSRSERTHTVRITEGSLLRQIMRADETRVNSYHHQAIRELAPGFRVSALAQDGIVEAMESDDGILCVQWHPEELQEYYQEQLRLFSYLVERCKG